MNKSLFILLSTLTMCANSAQKDELHYESIRPAIFAAAHLGQVGVAHNGKDFAVIKDGKAHPIKSYLVDKTLRGKSTKQVARYLAHHAIEIKEGSDHEFSLKAHNRQLGGGPATAAWFYSITKGGCYATLAVGAGAAIIKSGGAAIPAIKAAAPALKAGLMIAGNAPGVVGGGATVAGAIIEAGAVPVAVEGVKAAAGVAVANGWLAYIPAGIEVISAGAATIGMWLPLP